MEHNIKLFKYYGTLIIFASAIIHNAIYFDIETLFISVVLLYGWWIINEFVITPKNVMYFPVSTLMVTGLSLIHFLLPMPLMLLEAKPMAFNLRSPINTFVHHGIFVTVIVLTHVFYTAISANGNIFRSILYRTGFYSQPNNRIIWYTSYSGLAATVYNYFIFGALSSEVSDRGFIYYISSILSQYIWMPVIILFSKFRGDDVAEDKNQYFHIAFYVLIVSLIAISSNMRTLLFGGVVTIVSLIFFGFLLGMYRAERIFNINRVIFVVVAVAIVGGPVVDLGYAMIAVRGDRVNISAGELVKETLRMYGDDEALESFKKISQIDGAGDGGTSKVFGWDEKYINNIILNRYVNFKISDNSVFYAEQIGYGSEVMQDEMYSQIAALLPNIILKFFGYDLYKKNDVASYSIGDYIYSVATDNSSVLGSFVISSMPGIGLSIFGYWYPAICFFIFVIIFSMFDSFSVNIQGRVYFSYYFYSIIVLAFNYFNDRHVFTFEFRYIIRTYFESVAIFLLTMLVFNTVAERQRPR